MEIQSTSQSDSLSLLLHNQPGEKQQQQQRDTNYRTFHHRQVLFERNHNRDTGLVGNSPSITSTRCKESLQEIDQATFLGNSLLYRTYLPVGGGIYIWKINLGLLSANPSLRSGSLLVRKHLPCFTSSL